MESTIPHVNVLICTPGHSVMKEYLKSLIATFDVLNKENISYGYSIDYSSLVADARELTLDGNFAMNQYESRPFNGQVTYDKLFWIDSDISWTPEDFLALYKSDKDIISGGYLLPNGTVVAHKEVGSMPLTIEEFMKMKDPESIGAVGFGFLAVKQGVFESLSRPWFQSVSLTKTNIETGIEHTFPISGEDISWCYRVGKNGYKIWIHPSVKVTHHKTMKLTWEGIRPL